MNQTSTEIITNKLNTWGNQLASYTPNIIAALIALAVFILLAKILKQYINSAIAKFIKKNSLRRFSTSFIQFAIISLGLLIALSILNLGKAITSLLAGAGVAGLIIGFAMQEIISNYFSGITISLSEPFKMGDLVEINKELGVIKKIKIRTTVIETPQGQIIEMPNINVINNPIINYTITGKRRVDISSGISYDSDPEKAKKIALDTISKIKGVNQDMPIEFFYKDFGDSSLVFTLRFWMNFKNSQKAYFELKSEVITKLLENYDKKGIVMPYPTTTIKLENTN